MAENGGKQQFHIALWGEQVEDFRRVQAYTGIESNTDVFRWLLRQKRLEIEREERSAAARPMGAPVTARVFEE